MEQALLRILQQCRNAKELKQTHLQILARGLGQSCPLLPKLVDVSAAVHSLDYAVRVFRATQTHNVVVHNNMVKCFAAHKCPTGAFSTYDRMKALGVSPNNFTFTFLLKACESREFFEGGKEVHAQIIRYGFVSNVFVQNTLLDFYSKCCRELAFARRIFDEMPERDVVSWNAMVSAYAIRGDMELALVLFESMPERNVVSWNSVITGLSKAGDMHLAQLIFNRMAVRNVVSGNAMITGYVACSNMEAARSIFEQMEEKNVVTWSAMVSGYIKFGHKEAARKLFYQMPVKSVVSWNAMIAGYNQNCRYDLALQAFQEMLIDGRCMPDEVTLIIVASACGHLGSLEHGNWVYSYMKKNGFEFSISLGNAIIDMFSKCGDMKSSVAVFHQMTRRCVITWTTMIWGLAINGQCREAFSLFEEMCSLRAEPDDVTFIAVLSACTHGGLVEEGRRTFAQMVEEFGIKPKIEHYGCIVDLLARAGNLEEAIQFIRSMPMEPNAVIWAALLSSCKLYGNEELVDFVSRKMAELEPLDPGHQVLLVNSSAYIGRWEGVSSMREAMRQDGVEKIPGCSSIQVGGEVHEFLAKDLSHKRRGEIYEVLGGLAEIVRHVGRSVHIIDFPNEPTESELCL
ncbi:hypothetical protein Taro_001229 [Colocasia esculenta]|uniref:Chlororespiratory reduction 2 n=1 Tax=Colocasia esculenta TaxID=4460 RepID=A0A843TK32_COLES|nr:hypothetical protein [Colocasia esculenta]